MIQIRLAQPCFEQNTKFIDMSDHPYSGYVALLPMMCSALQASILYSVSGLCIFIVLVIV